MNLRQVLLPIYRFLRPVVDGLKLNRIARPVWKMLWQSGPDRLVYAEQNGRKWWLAPEVALRGKEQEIETVEWLRQTVKSGMTVLDVGANVGQMTLEMAQLVGHAGRVIAIEPGPGNLRLLTRHVERNGFSDRVTIIPCACCSEHGTKMSLSIPGNDRQAVGSGFQLAGIGIKSNPLAHGVVSTDIDVMTVSLDSLYQETASEVAVVKVDVEGAEVEVLRGARRLLENCRPVVRFGFHPFAFPDAAAAQREITAIFRAIEYTVGDGSMRAWVTEEIVAVPSARLSSNVVH